MSKTKNELKFHPYSSINELINECLRQVYGIDLMFSSLNSSQEGWHKSSETVFTLKSANLTYIIYHNHYPYCCGVHNMGSYTREYTNPDTENVTCLEKGGTGGIGYILPLLVMLVNKCGAFTMTANNKQDEGLKIADKLLRFLKGTSNKNFFNPNSRNYVTHYFIDNNRFSALKKPTKFFTREIWDVLTPENQVWYRKYYDLDTEYEVTTNYRNELVKILQEYKKC